MPLYAEPSTLIDEVARDTPRARIWWDAEFRPVVEKLVEQHKCRHVDVRGPANLVEMIRRWLQMFLSTLSATEGEVFDRQKKPWFVFNLYLVRAIQRLLLWRPVPSVISADARDAPGGETLRGDETSASDWGLRHNTDFAHVGYQVSGEYRPRDTVGGDWFYVHRDEDDRLWILVADTPDKSWGAYVLKRTIYFLWKDAFQKTYPSAGKLLDGLHGRLCGRLPEGCFLEVTVGSCTADGSIEVASAGSGYILIREARSGAVRYQRPGGPYLGVEFGIEICRDTLDVLLSEGDQLAVASDGLAEQPIGEIEQLGKELVLRLADASDLHSDTIAVWEAAVRAFGQRDDFTLVTVHRIPPVGVSPESSR